MSEETWELIEKRNNVKVQAEDCKEKRKEYQALDKQVKKSTSRDKKKWIHERATEAEDAATKGKTRQLYRLVNEICSTKVTSNELPILKSDGQLATTTEEKKELWKDHFEKLLNRPAPNQPIDFNEETYRPKLNIRNITQKKVQDTIKKMKNNKAQ